MSTLAERADEQAAADLALVEKISQEHTSGDAALPEAWPEAVKKAVQQAAELDGVAYDLQREKLAKAAGVRVATLDDERKKLRPPEAKDAQLQGEALTFDEPTPWPQAVEGAELLDDIARVLSEHVKLPPGAATAVTLWTCATYFSDVVDTAPILALRSPTKRCGKTTATAVISKLAYRPLPASNITPSALFRVIAKCAPTLLIDEADSFLSDHDELRGIVNAGHTRVLAFVLKTVGDDYEPRKFSVFGFKLLALIGKLPATITDRSLVVQMERKAKGERVKKLRDAPSGTFKGLCQKLARFRQDNAEAIGAAYPAIPAALNDRAADNWQPLLAIADAAGGHWPERARKAALLLSGDEEDDEISVRLLADIYALFYPSAVALEAGAQPMPDPVSSLNLVEALCRDDEAPWLTYNRGKAISQRQLATRLKAFGVVSGTVHPIGQKDAKGYKRAQFVHAWTRYLPQSVQPSKTNNGAAYSQNTKRPDLNSGRKPKPLQPSNGAGLDGRTDKKPPAGARAIKEAIQAIPDELILAGCGTPPPGRCIPVGGAPLTESQQKYGQLAGALPPEVEI